MFKVLENFPQKPSQITYLKIVDLKLWELYSFPKKKLIAPFAMSVIKLLMQLLLAVTESISVVISVISSIALVQQFHINCTKYLIFPLAGLVKHQLQSNSHSIICFV